MSTRLYPLLRLNYAKTTQLYFSIQFRLLVRYLSGFKQCSGKKSCAKLSDNFEGRRKIGKPVSYQLPSCFLSPHSKRVSHTFLHSIKNVWFTHFFCGCLPAYLPMSVSEVCSKQKLPLLSLYTKLQIFGRASHDWPKASVSYHATAMKGETLLFPICQLLPLFFTRRFSMKRAFIVVLNIKPHQENKWH